MKKKASVSNKSSDKKEPQLAFELVPKPLWGMNLRSESVLGRNGWGKLRKTLLQEHGRSICTTCKNEIDKPHAHEVWKYEEGKEYSTATITDIKIICSMFHNVHHFGRMRALFRKGLITKNKMIEIKNHFLQVNECTIEDFDAHQDITAKDWKRRNSQNWVINYGSYRKIVEETKAKRQQI